LTNEVSNGLGASGIGASVGMGNDDPVGLSSVDTSNRLCSNVDTALWDIVPLVKVRPLWYTNRVPFKNNLEIRIVQ